MVMFVALLAAVWAMPADPPPLKVVPAVDYKRYEGTWYEIARFPNRFQRTCESDVVATYTLREDGRLTVQNRCRRADGSAVEASGVARPVAGQPPSVLEVRFAPAFLSFLPAVWGDYQILALGADYEYALIGEPAREYLWVLSRSPTLDAGRYDALVAEAKAQGFEVSKLVRTRHTALQER
jgi:apolipoprotein D and lipocalin family protein